MKYIIWIGFIVIASCANKQEASVVGNQLYLVQLENFDLNVVSALEESLNSKTFAFQEQGIKETTSNTNGSNTFYFNRDMADFKKVIKVKNISKDSSNLEVNITFFKNNNQELNRYFNPGDFDLPNTNAAKALENLIVKLTFK